MHLHYECIHLLKTGMFCVCVCACVFSMVSFHIVQTLLKRNIIKRSIFFRTQMVTHVCIHEMIDFY